jgi:Rhodopirellula transposase DDE domain
MATVSTELSPAPRFQTSTCAAVGGEGTNFNHAAPFCDMTQNWRGKPLISLELIVSWIASTRTANGLKVKTQLDGRAFPSVVKVSNDELRRLHVNPAKFHGDWNYRITPRRKLT